MVDNVAAALEIAEESRHGSLRHDGPGRTDDLPISVPPESFVIPADIVSALGQGNTGAGFKVLEEIFPPQAQDQQPPQKFAGGGVAGEKGVPIVAAGGEFVVHPEHVKRVGGGNLKKGHDELRKFVEVIRKRTIAELKKLPGPVRG